MRAKIKSKKWYGRFWPPERRKVKILQAILDHNMPKIEKKVQEMTRLRLIYGLTEQEALKWIDNQEKKNETRQ